MSEQFEITRGDEARLLPARPTERTVHVAEGELHYATETKSPYVPDGTLTVGESKAFDSAIWLWAGDQGARVLVLP